MVGFCFLCLLYPHLLSPFIAVFHTASVFNQDVSKWNTGAVTSMEGSKCTHALSLVATPSVAMFLNIYDNSRVSSDHTSHTFCFLFVFVFCFLSLAVFLSATAFNQDVSKWNTGAVTTMVNSKCTFSLPLYGHAFRCCF